MYVTQNKQTLTYTGLSGLQEQVRQSGIERFQSEYPDLPPITKPLTA